MEWIPAIVLGLIGVAGAGWVGTRARRWWIGLLPLGVPAGLLGWGMLADSTEADGCGFGCASFLLYVLAYVSAFPAVALTVAFFCARAFARRRGALPVG